MPSGGTPAFARGSKELDDYLADFDRSFADRARWEPSWLREVRRSAMSSFTELGFPTTKQEAWKYTNVAPIAKARFRLAGLEPVASVREAEERVPFYESSAGLVFINGCWMGELPRTRALPAGVEVASLAGVLKADPGKIEPYLGRFAVHGGRSFVALNTAFTRDGAFVHVPRSAVVDEPMILLFYSDGRNGPLVSHPRNLIVLDDDSQAVIVECYLGNESDRYFTNAVTEVVAGRNARLVHHTLQLESRKAFHIAALQANIDQNSIFTSHSVQLGGALARNEIKAVLAGEGSESTLNGLYLATSGQHVDNQTRIDHVKPHCTSRELYKGILHGKSRGVFSGKIYVHKAAQKTDARQTNRNLLLSEDALIDTKPDLEIHADDVKCAHGSTIGQIDPNQMFYLRARGIGQAEARNLLTYAFANEMLASIPLPSIRRWLAERVTATLDEAA